MTLFSPDHRPVIYKSTKYVTVTQNVTFLQKEYPECISGPSLIKFSPLNTKFTTVSSDNVYVILWFRVLKQLRGEHKFDF